MPLAGCGCKLSLCEYYDLYALKISPLLDCRKQASLNPFRNIWISSMTSWNGFLNFVSRVIFSRPPRLIVAFLTSCQLMQQRPAAGLFSKTRSVRNFSWSEILFFFEIVRWNVVQIILSRFWWKIFSVNLRYTDIQASQTSHVTVLHPSKVEHSVNRRWKFL